MLETETMGTEAVGELVVGTVAGKDVCRRGAYCIIQSLMIHPNQAQFLFLNAIRDLKF